MMHLHAYNYINLVSLLLRFLTIGYSKCSNEEFASGPRFLSEPTGSELVVSEKDTQILTCQAYGHPQLQYQWLKNWRPINKFSIEHFLKIVAISKEDSGDYRCLVKNSMGTILSSKISIRVAYITPLNESGYDGDTNLVNEEQLISTGDAAVLSLPFFESYPAPSVTWHAHDTELLYSIKYIISNPHNDLIILDVSSEDSKVYRATITNQYLKQSYTTRGIKLSVEQSMKNEAIPSFVLLPSNITILKGTRITELQCIVNARPLGDLETVWLKDDVPINRSGIQHFLSAWNQTLSLLDVSEKHSGEYKCVVQLKKSLVRPISTKFTVTVEVPPIMESDLPEETQADLGKLLTLHCESTGIPFPLNRWFWNGIDVNDINNSRYQVLMNGSLSISPIEISDAGSFQCLSSNSVGERMTYTWLRVKKSAPTMHQPPVDQTALDGEDVTISCIVEGAPLPNITWFHNDKKLAESHHYHFAPNGLLKINGIDFKDEGNYTCIRANEAGAVTSTASLKVLVKTRIVTGPIDTRVVLGHIATMQCHVGSASTVVDLAINWLHEGIQLDRRSPHINIRSDGTLEIQQVRATDGGTYACEVVSRGGNDSKTAVLEVMDLPYPPRLLKAERIVGIQKTAKLSWTPNFDGNSPILKYIVYKKESITVTIIEDDFDLSWEVALTNVSAGATSVNVGNLRPSTGYQFKISAVNYVGEGLSSLPSHILVLPQEAPSGPPEGLVGSPRSSSEIMIQWEPPKEEERNGIIQGYLVRYRLSGYKEATWYFRNITKETQHNHLIDGLILWKKYEIQVAAFNIKGVGVYSQSIHVRTKEGIPLAPPRDLRAGAIDSTTIQVFWLPPLPWLINGINQGYKLQAWTESPDVTNVAFKTIKVAPSPYPEAIESANLTSLNKFTNYYITVLCFTHPGDGRRSVPIIVNTLEDVPDEVKNFKFNDVSDRHVTVSWDSPEKQNGILTGYTLIYQKKGSFNPNDKIVRNFTADVTSYSIDNLTAITLYVFEVNAWTSVGPGKSLIKSLMSGVEPVLPESPTRLAVSNIQPFSVVLQFTPGFDGNASIDLWKVYGKSIRSSSWEIIDELSAPDASTLTLKYLTPFTKYSLRLIAVNIVGESLPSLPSPEFQTLQAEPLHPPFNMTLRAMSPTEIRVRWIPLQQFEWYGTPRGYRIIYQQVGCNCVKKVQNAPEVTANSYQLMDLEEFSFYEVTVAAVNDIGSSEDSPLAIARTRESVPTAGPSNVTANATSSTTILVRWDTVPKLDRNGIIDGYKVVYAGQHLKPQQKIIENNTTFATTLTELKKFYQYTVQVKAYTRLGDGILSDPYVSVQTLEDVPGAPSSVSFPDVSFTYARIIWEVPQSPNGKITAYSITYHPIDNEYYNQSINLGPNARTYRAENLKPESNYLFLLKARTHLGWGHVLKAPVYTTNNRNSPTSPSRPTISQSQITAHSITFSWNPGKDGFAPIRYYSVQFMEAGSSWHHIDERIDYSSTSYTASNLRPFSVYSFRIKATNDIGDSEWSDSSIDTRTFPTAPTKFPSDIKVIPITRTSILLEWTPLELKSWNGDADTGGYKIHYRKIINNVPQTSLNTKIKVIHDIFAIRKILEDLQRDTNYEIVVTSFNALGDSSPSSPLTVYVGEAVPTGQPQHVRTTPLSSTEIKIDWEPPTEKDRNGELLGYKIFYQKMTDSSNGSLPSSMFEEEVEVVGPKRTSFELLYLNIFTEYVVTILPFNPAGDGPRSDPVSVRTKESLPGPVANLNFTDITMNSLRVIWNSPVKPNGHIRGYLVTYETARPNENFSKQVKQKVTTTYLLIQSLKEGVTYKFSIKAETIGYGLEVNMNVTTGPQPGSPARPKKVRLSKTVSSLTLHWRNSHPGDSKILGYYIEAKKKNDATWTMLMKTETDELEEYTVSYQNLLPATTYQFRLIAYNTYGISDPATADEMIVTPTKVFLKYDYLHQQPFYHQTWFMVTLAAISIVLIIVVIAALCVKSKTYKYKQEAVNKTNDSTCYPSYEMTHRSGTLNKRGTLNRSTLGRHSAGGAAAIALAKSPPRPAPSSVLYSDDDTMKGDDENQSDSSDVTEKPTDISSTDSQEDSTDTEEEDLNTTARHAEPHSFVNHYANVNETLKQSWQHQKPFRNYSSYTDSEAEGSAVMSLNGGQIVMNNMAGSRAPLPGFSSFV